MSSFLVGFTYPSTHVPSPSILFPSLLDVTCFSFCWTLFADFVVLEGPDVDVVENSGLQANQPVRGAVTSHGNLRTGARGRRVAQHVPLYFCMDSIPCHRDGVLCYFSGSQICRSINVWRETGQNNLMMYYDSNTIICTHLSERTHQNMSSFD